MGPLVAKAKLILAAQTPESHAASAVAQLRAMKWLAAGAGATADPTLLCVVAIQRRFRGLRARRAVAAKKAEA